MKNIIEINLDDQHCFNCGGEILARQNENRASALRLHLTEEMLDKWIYIDFLKADGSKVTTARLDDIDIENKTATFEITNQLTDVAGKIEIEIVIRNADGLVWKTFKKSYKIESAINASEELDKEEEDFITKAQKVLDEVKDYTTEYNKNVELKTKEFNDNATAKIEEYDENASDKTKELNENINAASNEVDKMLRDLNELSKQVEEKTSGFNDNAAKKLKDYNDNATSELKKYDDNATSELKDYNDNATSKLEEYNENATNKVAEFNNNVGSIENELTELAGQMPWNTTEIANSINVKDSAKFSRNKLDVFGNLEQEVTETGNNIFDGVMEVGNINNTTGENVISTTMIRSKNFIDISALTKVRVIRSDGYVGKDYYVGLRFYDADKNFLKYSTTSLGSSLSLSTETGIEGYKYLRFIITNTTDLTLKYGLNKNASETYEDYIPNKPTTENPSMPITATGVQKIAKLGKNYLNIPDTEIDTGSGVTIKVENNKIILNGTATVARTVTISSVLEIPLNGIYTFSQKVISGNATDGAYRVYVRDKATTDMLQAPLTFTSVTQKATNKCNTVITALAMYLNKGNTFNNYVIALQIEKSDTETDYEEPIEKETFELDLGTTELCKIVDGNNNVVAQDKIIFKDDKWQIEKQIGKVVYTGNENGWNRYVATSEGRQSGFYTALNTNTRYAVSNYYKYSNHSDVWAIPDCAFSISASSNICFVNNAITSINDFKNWLSTHNTEVYYKLAEIVYEDCTQEQAEVLDKLYKLSLQQGTNNIFVESENGLTTELQLTYMQDNNMIINNLQEQINVLSAAIINIGGNE